MHDRLRFGFGVGWLLGALLAGLAFAQALPEGVARVHYHRPDGLYDGFELHVWEDTTESVTWADGLDVAGRDDFGVFWDVSLQLGAERVGFIVHRGDEKDPGPDQFLDLAAMGNEVWIVSGNATVHAEMPDLQTASRGDLSAAQAHWLSPDLIAWRAGADGAGVRFTLHTSPDALLELTPGGVSGGEAIALEPDEAGLPAEIVERFPHLAGYGALRLPPDALTRVPDLLRTQTAVAVTGADGLLDATSLQLPGVLDALYAAHAADETLGVSLQAGVVTLALWAPTARSVSIHLFGGPDEEVAAEIVPMRRDDASGVWRVTGDMSWQDRYYLYEVTVFAPGTLAVETNLVTDPYAVALSRNSARSLIVDLGDEALMPHGWTTLVKPPLETFEDITVYELHLRDFSSNDPSVPPELQGTYLAFTEMASRGADHLAALSRAGLTHLHLLPTFDLATIDEDPTRRVEPDVPAVTPPSASPEPQAAVEAVRDQDAYNWGYDPWHYNVPEGSYASDAEGAARTLEYRAMVQAINDLGLRVVADVVYNHTNASGQAEKSVLDRIVPGYYHRLDENGQVATSTCCQNTASEHAMMRKLMVDSVVLWATEYKIDAFRFDLMGHHMVADMLAVRAALDALTLEEHGVDGRTVYLYGEGWNFGEVANGARGVNATQLNLAGSGIGTFNDRLRDAVRGGGPFDGGVDLIINQGFANGLYTLPNEAVSAPAEEQRARLLLAADLIRVGLAGNLRDFTFEGASGEIVSGADVDYNGAPAGYTADPQENIVYVSKHDNQTLWDNNQYKIALHAPLDTRVRMQTLGLSLVAFSQGIPFFHAGSDLLRSKSFDRDSFNSGDHFNRLDFSYRRNNFGVGLPPAGVNRDNWQVMRPRLEDPNLLPDEAAIRLSAALFQEFLTIRYGSKLFRLETAEEVGARLTFHNTGPDQHPGLIVMSLSDRVPGLADLDPDAELIVVAFNAGPTRATVTVPALAGLDLRLHPVQAASRDPLVRTAAMYTAGGQVSVPAHTTAVFVLAE